MLRSYGEEIKNRQSERLLTSKRIVEMALLVRWGSLHWSDQRIRNILYNNAFTQRQFKKYNLVATSHRRRLDQEIPEYPEKIVLNRYIAEQSTP